MIWHHDLDPFLIQFTEQIGIRWYGLAYLAGFLSGYILLKLQARRGWLDLTAERIADFVMYVAIAGVIGGRIGYVFFYDFRGFLDDPVSIVKIWEGGMSIHGGFIGGIVGTLLVARRERLPFLHLADALALATPPGLMFGRIANFINGELWGRPTDGSWGVIFPFAPTGPDGAPIPRHPSQLYQASLEGPLLLAALWFVRKRAPRSGVATATFFIVYSVLRFGVEYFREPDAHIGFLIAGLSSGQIYSFLTLIAGIIILVRPAQK